MLLTRPLPSSIDLLDLHRQSPLRYPVLLESSAGGTAQGRWDLLLAAGDEWLRLDADGVTRDHEGREFAGDFLSALDTTWRSQRQLRDEPRWPFRGGWALLLAYEMAAQVEPILRLPAAGGGVPVALALRCPAALLRDRASGECIAVAEPAHAALLDRIGDDVVAAAAMPALTPWQPPVELHEDPPRRYTDGVARILDCTSASGNALTLELARTGSIAYSDVKAFN